MEKFSIFFSDEASVEYRSLMGNIVLGELAERYLGDLLDFPPEAWGDIHRKDASIWFKSDNHVMFDIQGKVLVDEKGEACGVRITRFRLRKKA